MNEDGFLTLGDTRKILKKTRGATRKWLFEQAEKRQDVRLLLVRTEEANESSPLFVDPDGLGKIIGRRLVSARVAKVVWS